MLTTQNIGVKTGVLSVLLVFGVLMAWSNDLAISDPIPTPMPIATKISVRTEKMEASKTEALQISVEAVAEEPEPISFSETIHLYRRENMNRILSGFHTGLHENQDRNLVAFISQESRQYGFEPELILALISTESSFYNWSVSNKGAVGLMQIVPATGRELARATRISWNNAGNESLFDPYINIKLGIRYLHSLNEQFHDIKIALTAYNFGPTRVRRWVRNGRPIPSGYANKVLKAYSRYIADTQKRIAAAILTPSVPEASDQGDT